MIKPICVIYYLPELFKNTHGPLVRDMNEAMRKIFPDYNVLAIPSKMSADGSCEDVRLQVFHPKDFTEIQFQELSDMVMKEIEKLKVE